ncbi:hypothetical protein [Hymenobacter properus]|uniref:T9SS type A sorting domain-containing protein n=1 Tax=Hymenobacter properus TaxID=2791026 RepID=A0A931BKK6_9BACT|nr:hypothetical protein [Hymenobacter properus]MBF9141963.1 hypothetical protein [Hymenobacter properus]MBR7720770.1 hypothetical protein [Microvirga sp. SRT04]
MLTAFRLRSLLGALFLWLSSSSAAWASHALGADITYEYAGTATSPDQYHVTVRLFRDLGSPVDDPYVTLNGGRNGCSATTPGGFTMMVPRSRRTMVSASCNSTPINYELNTYDALVQLPPASWTLSVEMSNRASGIANIANSQTQSIFVKTELNNSSGLVNSSPRFLVDRLIQLTSSQAQQHYSIGAFDSEGDSLAYRLVQPLANPTPTAPCGMLTVGAIAPHFQVDAATGELVTVAGPTQQGYYVLAARVDEYRRVNGSWQQIGSITRDMAYFVFAGTNQTPVFTRVALDSAPSGQLLGQTIQAYPGTQLSLRLTATDPDAGQTLALSGPSAGAVPGAAFQDLGGGQAQLTWQIPATLPAGRYLLAATALDNYCASPAFAVVTVPVQVVQRVLATAKRQALAQAPFPVPFSEVVRFRFAGAGVQPVTITDALGRQVAQLATAADGSVVWQPGASLSAGLYFARNLAGTQVARLQYSGQ